MACRLALNLEAPSHLKVPIYLSTTPMYKETTRIPLGLWPYGSTSIWHGQTRRNDMFLPPQLSSIKPVFMGPGRYCWDGAGAVGLADLALLQDWFCVALHFN
jgi:hypothetical protein